MGNIVGPKINPLKVETYKYNNTNHKPTLLLHNHTYIYTLCLTQIAIVKHRWFVCRYCFCNCYARTYYESLPEL